MKLRFAKINPCEKSTGSQFAKLNAREMLKKWFAKINPCENLYQVLAYLKMAHKRFQCCYVGFKC